VTKYHMNRKEKEITERSTLIEILKKGKFSSNALCREGEPYIVTLNYGYDHSRNALYFHCAAKGLKLDFIKANPKACATVIEDLGYRTGECEHAYRSVVLWGRMHIVRELQEKKHAIDVLLAHLEDDPRQVKEKSIKSEETYEKVGILRLDTEEMTGKCGE
jgi:nitroimidazol reductase NimA-like FMN-containing flavoprotein (pyridoxamine 5'-phosphate oxidase superfamily)